MPTAQPRRIVGVIERPVAGHRQPSGREPQRGVAGKYGQSERYRPCPCPAVGRCHGVELRIQPGVARAVVVVFRIIDSQPAVADPDAARSEDFLGAVVAVGRFREELRSAPADEVPAGGDHHPLPRLVLASHAVRIDGIKGALKIGDRGVVGIAPVAGRHVNYGVFRFDARQVSGGIVRISENGDTVCSLWFGSRCGRRAFVPVPAAGRQKQAE